MLRPVRATPCLLPFTAWVITVQLLTLDPSVHYCRVKQYAVGKLAVDGSSATFHTANRRPVQSGVPRPHGNDKLHKERLN